MVDGLVDSSVDWSVSSCFDSGFASVSFLDVNVNALGFGSFVVRLDEGLDGFILACSIRNDRSLTEKLLQIERRRF